MHQMMMHKCMAVSPQLWLRRYVRSLTALAPPGQGLAVYSCLHVLHAEAFLSGTALSLAYCRTGVPSPHKACRLRPPGVAGSVVCTLGGVPPPVCTS